MSVVRKVVATLGASAILLTGGVLVGSPAAADPVPDIINVTDAPYNAIGDGVTDNTAAIQAAADAATGTGATVLIPEGGRFLTSGVIVGSDSTLQVDGMLLQSQNPAHYTYPVATNHRPGPLKNDLSSFQNLPFVFATESENVKIIGDGVIQLTRAATEALTVHTIGVGLFDVDGFEIRGVDVLGASSYTVGLYVSRNGVVADTRLIPGSRYGDTPDGPHANTDGISIMNSQNIRITGNYLRTSDDGVYLWSNFDDPRSVGRWWHKDDPQPTKFIEIDNNDIAVTCCKAFTFIAWGIDAPDQRDVEITDVYVHDNRLEANGDAVGCWCDARYPNDQAGEGQSPIARVTFENNEYIGRVDNTFNTAQITDLRTDFGALGVRHIMNGDFEKTGMAWWSASGSESDVGAITAAENSQLRDPAARAAIASMDGFVGFVQSEDSTPVRLYQGIGMSGNAMPEVPFPTDVFELTADVAIGNGPAKLFVYDTCQGTMLAEKDVESATVQAVSIMFRVEDDCANVHVGIESAYAGGWALIDNVVVTSAITAIDNEDAVVQYTGTWQTYTNDGAWAGTNAIARNAGSAVDIPFTGSRAVLLALKDYNLGLANVYLDGELVTQADFYAPTKEAGKVIFDSGEIEDGPHVIRVEYTGQKNPASEGVIIVFDAVLIPTEVPDLVRPAVSLDVQPAGDDEWLIAGAELTITAEDADSGVESVEYRVGEGAWTAYAGPVALADGEYVVSARATDVAGNVSAVVSESVKVDTLAPEAWVWLDEDGAVSAFARDAGPSGIDRIEYSLDEGVTWLDGLSALIAEEASPAGFQYRAVDVAGNMSAAQAVSESVLPVEVDADDRILVEFSGFEDGDQVHVELHSDPVRLGTFAANSLGVVSTLVTVPSAFESGTHGLVAFTGSGESGGGEAGTDGGGSLGSTGAEPMPLLIGGLIVLLLGAAALTINRTRQTRTGN